MRYEIIFSRSFILLPILWGMKKKQTRPFFPLAGTMLYNLCHYHDSDVFSDISHVKTRSAVRSVGCVKEKNIHKNTRKNYPSSHAGRKSSKWFIFVYLIIRVHTYVLNIINSKVTLYLYYAFIAKLLH